MIANTPSIVNPRRIGKCKSLRGRCWKNSGEATVAGTEGIGWGKRDSMVRR